MYSARSRLTTPQDEPACTSQTWIGDRRIIRAEDALEITQVTTQWIRDPRDMRTATLSKVLATLQEMFAP